MEGIGDVTVLGGEVGGCALLLTVDSWKGGMVGRLCFFEGGVWGGDFVGPGLRRDDRGWDGGGGGGVRGFG